jgi:AraC-like DNA-binding protein
MLTRTFFVLPCRIGHLKNLRHSRFIWLTRQLKGFILIDNPTLLALNISTLVIIIFSANLLFLRSFKRQVYLPLAIFLLAIGVIICRPTLAVFFPLLQPIFIIFSLPALLLIGPCFWFYVQGLTHETPWHFTRQSKHHFIPFVFGAFIALISLLLPAEIRHALLVDGNEGILASTSIVLRYVIYGLLITTFTLVLGWVIQSGFYFYQIIRQLNSYRRHLKDLFASTESKEIQWLSWLLFAVGTVWSATVVNIVLDNLFFSVQWNAMLSNGIVFVMIWSISTWGLRQKPGFEELYDNNEDIKVKVVQDSIPQAKYQRSPLDEQQASQIARKIAKAMREDKIYLDASLSLQKLAKYISTSPNYISQTLNETLGMNFFDYVNKYRVEAAQQHLEHTNNTVLDIAMTVGFNAKSSFYTAFKKETHQTPSQYRKQCLLPRK